MKFTEVAKYYWKSTDGRFIIQRFTYRLKGSRHYECEPYFNAYTSSSGKRIYADAPTFERAAQACEDLY